MDHPTVLLVHGLYLRPWTLGLLARRLEHEGYQTLAFAYDSLTTPLIPSAERLYLVIKELEPPPPILHLVGHSLGGLIIQAMFYAHEDAPPGRAVTLGTPHRGSGTARRLVGRRWLGWSVGRALRPGLLGDMPDWPAQRELGVIAGDLSFGMGRLFGGQGVPGDGTVAIEETLSDGMTDHIVLPVTHTGLLLSKGVHRQVAAFLASGRFQHPGKA